MCRPSVVVRCHPSLVVGLCIFITLQDAVLADPLCGGIFRNVTQPQGSLPFNRMAVAHPADCLWVVERTSSSKVTLKLPYTAIVMRDMYLEQGDWLAIYDGRNDSSNVIKEFHGPFTSDIEMFVSTDVNTTIVFRTNSTHKSSGQAFRGFKGLYMMGGCSISIGVDSPKIISSPSYIVKPGVNINLTCTITLSVKQNRLEQDRLHMSFTHFSLRPGNGSVHIIDGKRQQGMNIGTYTAKGHYPEDIISKTAQLVLLYHTNVKHGKSSFKLLVKTVDKVCSDMINLGSGPRQISTPNYPEQSPTSLNCVWLVRVMDGSTISSQVVGGNLDNLSYLSGRFTLYDGSNVSSHRRIDYGESGMRKDKIFVTSRNYLMMTFQSGMDGFREGLTLTLELRGQDEGGYISATSDMNGIMSYPHDLKSQGTQNIYQIGVLLSKLITFRVDDSHTQLGERDYLLIYQEINADYDEVFGEDGDKKVLMNYTSSSNTYRATTSPLARHVMLVFSGFSTHSSTLLLHYKAVKEAPSDSKPTSVPSDTPVYTSIIITMSSIILIIIGATMWIKRKVIIGKCKRDMDPINLDDN